MSAFEITQPDIHTRPLAAAGLWQRVVDAAGSRCQCTGSCGNQHSKTERRCGARHDVYAAEYGGWVRLVVAPANLTLPPAQAATLPEARLRAWCPRCYRAAQRRQRAADEHRRRFAAPPPAALFDL
jgi:hypothetical protein